VSESIGSSGKGMKLHTKILLGLAIGAVLGVVANQTLGADHEFVRGVNTYVAGPIGQVFLRLLFMIVMPLVFASIALGVAGLGDVRKVGRVGGKAIGYFLGTTALAATLGLIVVNIARPWNQVSPETRTELLARFAGEAAQKVEASATASSAFGIQTLVNIIPRNPIKAMVDGDMLAVIFFGLIVGAALTLIAAEKAAPLLRLLEAIEEVVIKIVGMAMQLAPLGVAGLIFGVTSQFGFDLLRAIAAFVLTVLVALLLQAGITIPLILRFVVGISPALFFTRVRSALVTAFSTSSSSATLPTALAASEQNLGIPPRIARFVLPLGSTMCMNGTAIFEGITVIFLAELFGVDLTVPQMAVVMVMSVLTAVGAAGVPGGSIPLLVGILAMFKVPGEAIAIVLGVDRILDMSRTTVNVWGDLSATAFVAKSEAGWHAGLVPATIGAIDTAPTRDDSPGWPVEERTGGPTVKL
jgi:dicarboxylate/amino acid:cation (Na+ or H+) symporter, DAACS family